MRIVQIGIILLLGWWIYSPALNGEWLFDDIPRILADSGLHSLSGLWRIWFAASGTDYFPLTETVRCLQWQIFGRDSFGYHATNVLLHVANALLIWRLFSRLEIRLAWLGGLLFVIHPLCVESVAWISELKNTLSLLFLLVAMLAYLDFDTKGHRAFYLRSLAAFLAALLAKTSVVMFPVIILLYGWWRRGSIRREDWKRSAPFFAMSLVLGFVTMVFQQHLDMNVDPSEMPDLFSRVLRADMIVAFYLSKFFLPVSLDIVYPRWDVGTALPWEIFFCLALALFAGWIWSRRSTWSRDVLFGFLFFLINLAPVLGFTGMMWMNYSWVADHFTYLPMIGLLGLVVAAAGNLYETHLEAQRWIIGAIACLIVLFFWQSYAQAKLFSTSLALWTHDLELNPDSWLGYNNVAVALSAKGNPEGAILALRLGLKVRPDQALAYSNLGNALAQASHFAEAMEAGEKAVALQPENGLLHNQYGNVLAEAGHLDEAIAEYRAALRLDPNDVVAHSDLVGVYLQQKRVPDALEEGQIAVRADPHYPAAHDNYGIALGQAGRFAEAAKEFSLAASMLPDDPEIQRNWGVALLKTGDKVEAYKHFQKAAELSKSIAPTR